jgi:hypothetical protein
MFSERKVIKYQSVCTSPCQAIIIVKIYINFPFAQQAASRIILFFFEVDGFFFSE